MSTLSLKLPEGRKKFEPGEEVEITAAWDLNDEAEAIEFRAVWRTSGKGDTDIGVADTLRFDHPSRSETRRATVRLPHAPYSFSGQLVSLSWTLELVALPGEEFDQCHVTIAPNRREVRLRGGSSGDEIQPDSNDEHELTADDEEF